MEYENEEFWAIIRESGGLPTRAARIMAKTYPNDPDKKLTRQAIWQRCNRKKEIFDDIRNQVLDEAEEILQSIIRDKKTPASVRLKAVQFYLERIGKHRGFTRTIEIDGNSSHTINFKD